MRIEGLSHTPKVSQINARNDTTRAKKPAEGGDVVELSQDAQEVSDLTAKITGSNETGMSPRLQEIRAKIATGFFNTREGLEAIAEALEEADPIADVVGEIETVKLAKRQLEELPDVRPEKVQDAKQKVEQNFYFEPQAEADTAENILNEMM